MRLRGSGTNEMRDCSDVVILAYYLYSTYLWVGVGPKHMHAVEMYEGDSEVFSETLLTLVSIILSALVPCDGHPLGGCT